MKSRLLMLVTALLFAVTSASASPSVPFPALHQGDIILFQGDSITDGNRGRNADPNHILGHGYAFIIAAKTGATFPERQLTFINRGTSGNRVSDLAARWPADTLAHKPTLLSILIGINDTLRNTPIPAWETAYDKLLADTLSALPGVRIVLGEPFTLKVGKPAADWERWNADVKARQAAVARLAAKYKLPVVPFQKIFDDACQRAPGEYWIWDGIHPTYSGHQLMADAWVQTVNASWPR